MTAPRNLRITVVFALGLVGILALVVILMAGSAGAQSTPQLKISDASGEEGSTISFEITLTEKSQSDVVVTAKTNTRTGATAKQNDFVAKEERVTIPAGNLEAEFTVETVDDDKVESAESFFVKLSRANGATIDRARAKGTITDNDVEPENTSQGQLQSDYGKVKQAMEDSLAGCLVYGAEGATGDLIYVSNNDNARCVPLRELTDAACVPYSYSGTNGRADTRKYSVFWTESGPLYIGGLREKFQAFDFRVTLPENGKSAYGDSSTEGEIAGSGLHQSDFIDYKVFISYESGKDSLILDYGDNVYDYAVGAQIFETSGTDLTAEVHGPSLDFLYQRMKDIAEGNDYYIPSDCLFKEGSDLRDRFEHPINNEAFGALTLGESFQGELDSGPDVDWFEITLEEDVQYIFSVAGIDPDEVDADSVPFVSGAPSDDVKLDLVHPAIRILDADGQELGVGQANAPITFVANSDGAHYVEVSHVKEERWVNAGIYTLEAAILNEEVGDLPADTTTILTLLEGADSIRAQITPDDTDWFRVRAEAHLNHTIVVQGDDSDGNTALATPALTLYDADGNAADADEYATSAIGDYQILDLFPHSTDEYYVAVSGAAATDEGFYSIWMPGDDHVTLHHHVDNTVDKDTTVSGAIQGPWDRDRVKVQIEDGHNWVIEVIPEGDTPAGTEFTISVVDDPDRPYSRGWHTLTRDDGSVVLVTIDSGLTGPISYNGQTYETKEVARFVADVELADGADAPAEYRVSVRAPQYQEITNTTDQHTGTTWAQDPDLHRVSVDADGVGSFSASLNGNGDKDSFALNLLEGEYTFEIVVADAEAVTGMGVERFIRGQLSGYLEPGSLTVSGLGGGNSLNPADGVSFRVINHNPDTTLDYELRFVPVE